MILSLLYMLDVIHLIVTILSDHPSFEWECNVTGRPIWFCPLKLTFSACFRVVVALQWHGRDAVRGFDKRTVGGPRDGDWRWWLSSSATSPAKKIWLINGVSLRRNNLLLTNGMNSANLFGNNIFFLFLFGGVSGIDFLQTRIYRIYALYV